MPNVLMVGGPLNGQFYDVPDVENCFQYLEAQDRPVKPLDSFYWVSPFVETTSVYWPKTFYRKGRSADGARYEGVPFKAMVLQGLDEENAIQLMRKFS